MDRLINSQKWLDFWYTSTWIHWAKRLTILAVVGISGLLAVIGSTDIFIAILAISVVLLIVILLIRSPVLGFFGVLFGGFFVPLYGPGGFNMAVLALIGTIGLWIIDMIIRQRKLSLVKTPVNLPILAFMISAVISFATGQLPWYPLARQAPLDTQVGGLMIFLLSALGFLAVGNMVRDVRWLKLFTWTFLAIGALFIVLRLVPPLYRILARFYSSGVTANAIFWIWLLIITFSQLLLNRHLNMLWRAALGVLLVAILYVAVIQSYDWKSGFIPPIAGVMFIIALLLRRHVAWFIPPVLIGAAYVLFQAIMSDGYSWISRLEAWIIVADMSKVNPLFGLGFANYYWYTLLVPINGWYVNFNSHSQYVDIFSQTGLVGMVCFLWIFWEIGKLGWKIKDRVPEGFAKAYVYGVMGGLVATLVAGGLVDWILPFAYNIGLHGFRASMLGWLFLGGIVTINQMVDNTAQAENGIVQEQVPITRR